MRDLLPRYRQPLADDGFTDIFTEVCEINTPEECACWKAKTIVVPICAKR